MKVTRTEREGEHLLQEMVQLVQNTYGETLAAGDGRGLVRLEQAWYRTRMRRGISGLSTGLGWLAAATAVVALVVGGVVLFQRNSRLTYEVMNGAVGPGGFVRPTAAGGTAIVFSEGSEIALGMAARARVDGTTADGGRVVLESGSVHARIVPRKHARWFVEAGPYTIRVTGTAFNVKWSWTDELLDLRMDRGSVVVTGPLAPGGVTLTAGMRLTANPRAGLSIGGVPAASASRASDGLGVRTDAGKGAKSGQGLGSQGSVDDEALPSEEPAAPAADLGPQAAAAPSPDSTLGAGERVRATGAAVRTMRSSAAARRAAERRAAYAASHNGEGWDRWLARGDVQEIIDDAEVRGVDHVLVSASGHDLSALADAARYGHRPALARRVLLTMRDRFPRSAEGRDAAFFLGGLAEDAGGSGDQTAAQKAAVEWYDRYLGESGHGRYAAQALGRKMVMTQKLKGIEAARPIADEYLVRFPEGPYAAAARKLMRAP